MSLLPPAFKDPAFAPLGPPIRKLAGYTAFDLQKFERSVFESENHGNADAGCLQESCMPPAGKEVLRRGEIGRLVPVGALGPHEMLDADVAHMRESKPSPKLESALNAAQAALAAHLFGEAKKVKDPFEKVTMKLRAKDVERAAQMRAKADALWVACGAGQTATGMMLLQEAANRQMRETWNDDAGARKLQLKPKSLREACCDKMFDLTKKDKPLVTNILRLFGAATLAGIGDKYLPDLWDQLNRPF